MVCECAGCSEFGCNFFTVHRWTGDFDFMNWDITTGSDWRDYLTDNQPQKTNLVWRIRYDGEPYDDFMRLEFPRYSYHSWSDVWDVLYAGPVRDNKCCSPWWAARLNSGFTHTPANRLMHFSLNTAGSETMYWNGVFNDALPFALDVGCVRCGQRGRPNNAANWPNPPGYWHDFEIDYIGPIPDQFQLPTDADILAWIAAKKVSDQALYPDEFLPDVLDRWKVRTNHTADNFGEPSGRVITQAALWAGDSGHPNPSIGCVPGVIAWSNRRGTHSFGYQSAFAMDEDSNHNTFAAVPSGGRSVAWYEGFATLGGGYSQHTTHVTLSEFTAAVYLVSARRRHGSSHDDDGVPMHCYASPSEWVPPLIDWLNTGDKVLIIDNPACNLLASGDITGYPDHPPQVPGFPVPYDLAAVYPSTTTGHAAAANAMLSALGSSISLGELVDMSQTRTGLYAFANSSITLAAVGSDPLTSGYNTHTVPALGMGGEENSRWGWKLSGGTALIQATRKFAATQTDAVGYDETWTCAAVDRFANGSMIVVGGWEESHSKVGGFWGGLSTTLWNNILAELQT